MNEEARQQFEAWTKRQEQRNYPFPLELARLGDDYKYQDTRFAWLVWQAGSDAMKERAAQAINDYFDKWMSCDCQPDKGTAKYNTKSGHATNCILDDQFRLLAEIRALESEKGSAK